MEVGEATIEQAKAALKTAQANLDYCTIKSPIEGVIIDRRVNVGQTVVSSLSASSLCLLAKDLRRIQVWASVNEADIGRIQVGTAGDLHGGRLSATRSSRAKWTRSA